MRGERCFRRRACVRDQRSMVTILCVPAGRSRSWCRRATRCRFRRQRSACRADAQRNACRRRRSRPDHRPVYRRRRRQSRAQQGARLRPPASPNMARSRSIAAAHRPGRRTARPQAGHRRRRRRGRGRAARRHIRSAPRPGTDSGAQIAPRHWRSVAREQPAGRAIDARPATTYVSAGSRSARARQRKAARGERHRLDRDRRRLRLRLAGVRIGRGRDQIADARRRRVGVAPMDRHEQRAAPLAVAGHDLENASAVAAADTREFVRRQADAPWRRADGFPGTAPACARRALGLCRCASWCATGRAAARC